LQFPLLTATPSNHSFPAVAFIVSRDKYGWRV
jgi:hypothetical protein